MTAAAKPPPDYPFRLAGADLMRVTLGQLRAWEGTEIDALRTVL